MAYPCLLLSQNDQCFIFWFQIVYLRIYPIIQRFQHATVQAFYTCGGQITCPVKL